MADTLAVKKPTKLERDYARMFLALSRIKRYQSVAYMRRHSEGDWGLNFQETLEYAYENVQGEARNGLKGVRRPR